jgi:hypothetical protein
VSGTETARLSVAVAPDNAFGALTGLIGQATTYRVVELAPLVVSGRLSLELDQAPATACSGCSPVPGQAT